MEKNHSSPIHVRNLLLQHKKSYKPRVSSLLKDISSLTFKRVSIQPELNSLSKEERGEIDRILPTIKNFRDSRVVFHEAHHKPHQHHEVIMKIGVVFSGGPAPGGNNVLSGIFDALEETASGRFHLIGFLNGPQGLIENRYIDFDRKIIDSIRNIGGFDCIGSGRTKVETQEDFDNVIKTVQMHQLTGLVIIGGDDSNTNAAFIANELHLRGIRSCTVIGVPKTIDGDLQSKDIPISFGFDTATKVYSSLISNIARDCLSTKKYFYFIRLMGRSASHITLECALSTHPTLSFISEEVAQERKTLLEITQEIVSVVVKRIESGKPYGIILIPEGLIESMVDVKALLDELNVLLSSHHPLYNELKDIIIPQKRLEYIYDHLSDDAKNTLSFFPLSYELQLIEERDPHGNVQVSKIETEGLIEKLVSQELQRKYPELYSKYSSQTTFYGYEGRSADPSHFDCAYCYNLGLVAAAAIQHQLNGHIVSLKNLHLPPEEWKPVAIPLIDLLHFEQRSGKMRAVIKKELVDLSGALFKRYKGLRQEWIMEDAFEFTLPPQFWGPKDLVDLPCTTIMSQYGQLTE